MTAQRCLIFTLTITLIHIGMCLCFPQLQSIEIPAKTNAYLVYSQIDNYPPNFQISSQAGLVQNGFPNFSLNITGSSWDQDTISDDWPVDNRTGEVAGLLIAAFDPLSGIHSKHTFDITSNDASSSALNAGDLTDFLDNLPNKTVIAAVVLGNFKMDAQEWCPGCARRFTDMFNSQLAWDVAGNTAYVLIAQKAVGTIAECSFTPQDGNCQGGICTCERETYHYFDLDVFFYFQTAPTTLVLPAIDTDGNLSFSYNNSNVILFKNEILQILPNPNNFPATVSLFSDVLDDESELDLEIGNNFYEMTSTYAGEDHSFGLDLFRAPGCIEIPPNDNSFIVSCAEGRIDKFCVYDCNTGWMPSHGDASITCLVTGDWDGVPPECGSPDIRITFDSLFIVDSNQEPLIQNQDWAISLPFNPNVQDYTVTLPFDALNAKFTYYTPNNDSTLSINGETAPELSGDMTIPLNKAFKTQIDFSTQFLDPTLGTINNKYVLTFDRVEGCLDTPVSGINTLPIGDCDPLAPDDTCTWECTHGFALSSGSETVTCLDDGTFDSTGLVCADDDTRLASLNYLFFGYNDVVIPISTPLFDPDTKTYAFTIPFEVAYVVLTGTLFHDSAVLTLNNVPSSFDGTSTSFPLTSGLNTNTIQVTSGEFEGGYTLDITKEIECTPNVGAINAVSDCKGFTPNEACTYSCTDGWSETGGNENVQCVEVDGSWDWDVASLECLAIDARLKSVEFQIRDEDGKVLPVRIEDLPQVEPGVNEYDNTIEFEAKTLEILDVEPLHDGAEVFVDSVPFTDPVSFDFQADELRTITIDVSIANDTTEYKFNIRRAQGCQALTPNPHASVVTDQCVEGTVGGTCMYECDKGWSQSGGTATVTCSSGGSFSQNALLKCDNPDFSFESITIHFPSGEDDVVPTFSENSNVYDAGDVPFASNFFTFEITPTNKDAVFEISSSVNNVEPELYEATTVSRVFPIQIGSDNQYLITVTIEDHPVDIFRLEFDRTSGCHPLPTGNNVKTIQDCSSLQLGQTCEWECLTGWVATSGSTKLDCTTEGFWVGEFEGNSTDLPLDCSFGIPDLTDLSLTFTGKFAEGLTQPRYLFNPDSDDQGTGSIPFDFDTVTFHVQRLAAAAKVTILSLANVNEGVHTPEEPLKLNEGTLNVFEVTVELDDPRPDTDTIYSKTYTVKLDRASNPAVSAPQNVDGPDHQKHALSGFQVVVIALGSVLAVLLTIFGVILYRNRRKGSVQRKQEFISSPFGTDT